MYQDVLTNKAVKAATDIISIMAKTQTQVAAAQGAAQQVAEEQVNNAVIAPELETTDDAAEETAEDDIFASIMAEEDDDVKSREDIIKELLASGKAKLLKGLTVKNVVATQFDTHALLTFITKEVVIGDVRDKEEVDTFGQPVVRLGKTHNVQTSSYAVSGIMKDTPKTAVFAAKVVDSPDFANLLFAGGRIDIIMQYVKAGEPYTNPFASNAEEVTFERDKMIHHIVRLEMGEVGQDAYRTMLLK